MKSKHNGVRAVLLWATTAIFMMPIYWLLISSLKTDSEITMFPPTFWPRVFAWKNYPEVWHYLHFARTFMNSIIVSATATLLIVLFSTMAGYAFAKKDFIGKNILMIVLVGTMTIPAMTLLLPLFVIITRLGMYDRLIGLILPFSVTVFGIYFMKQYIADVPDSLLEAARIDGCGEFRLFGSVVLPLIRPGLIGLTIIEFVNNWNSFTMPLVLLRSTEKYTLPLRLGLLATERVAIPWSMIMAANVLTIIPVVVLFLTLQKYLFKGIMDGAIKG